MFIHAICGVGNQISGQVQLVDSTLRIFVYELLDCFGLQSKRTQSLAKVVVEFPGYAFALILLGSDQMFE